MSKDNKDKFVPATLCVVILVSIFCAASVKAAPPINRQMEIIEATIDGGGPQTIDPAAAYDTASGELLMNMYDTLVFFNGEHLDQYMPQLASSWTLENITGMGPKNGDLDLYFRYTFKMNSSAHFWNGDPVTARDVEYCIEREMYMDFNGGPQWMFFEPLLNTWGILGLNTTNLEDNLTEQARVGAYINNAVQANDTHVWFNLAFPGAYAPFMQILSQTWSSVYSKAWAIGLGRATNWDGDYAHWYASWNPALPPFDDPTPVAMGSGPFVLANLDSTNMFWDADRFTNYWRGWPLDWPAFGDSKPAGFVDHIKVTWAYNWATRSIMFLNGDVDYCAVPRQFMSVVLNQPGIRCTYPLPSLAVDALFYNFNIDPSTPYGTIYDYGVLGENGIPRDFFSDINVRKAFSHCIDFTSFINTAYGGEAMQPPTALIPGLPYFNATIPKYDYNLATATTLLEAAWGGQLWNTGFTIQLMYNQGNLARQTICDMLAAELNKLNPKFHASSTSVPWASYLYARDHLQLTAFTLGWLADYPDAHDFAYVFYYTYGNFAWRASYSDPQMDALIELGIRTPDSPARAQIYSDIQQRAIDTCPSVALDQVIGRHFEQTWMVDWYYNMVSPGEYFANKWKEYYIPHSLSDTVPSVPLSNYLPYDVNYDGWIDYWDLEPATKAFGSNYGPPMSPKWDFRVDINNDRKIDPKDYGKIAANMMRVQLPGPPHGGDISVVAESSKSNVSIGYNMNVTVVIYNVTAFSAYDLYLKYNETALEFVACDVKAVPSWESVIGGYGVSGNASIGVLRILNSTQFPFTGNTALFTVTFKGLAKGTAAFDLSMGVIATNLPKQDVAYNPVNCEVTVTITGDINGDGIVNMRDISYVARRFLVAPGDPMWDPNADVNNDGKIDMQDIAITARHFMETDP